MAMNVVPHLESTTEVITSSDGSTKPALERQKVTGGAGHVGIFDSSGNRIDTFGQGPYPESWAINASYVTAVAAIGTLLGLANYSKFTVIISGLTTETVSITGLIGANQDVETAALRPIDANTGALTAASLLGNGTYRFSDLAIHSMKFTKSAASETATVTVLGKA